MQIVEKINWIGDYELSGTPGEFLRVYQGNGRVEPGAPASAARTVVGVALVDVGRRAYVQRPRPEAEDVEPGRDGPLDTAWGHFAALLGSAGALSKKGAAPCGAAPFASKWLPGQDSNLQPSG